MDLCAYDPTSDMTIVFSNPADALIARLRLETGLGSTVIDLFIQSLLHPAFNAQQVRIRSVSEIDATVAAQREALRTTRSDSSSQSIPYPILECILNHIATDPELMDEPLEYQLPDIDRIEILRSDCLRQCALVHRTWTRLSQQRLAYRIVVRTPQEIVRLLRSPLPGRHTKELFISFGSFFSTRYQGRGQISHSFQHSDIENDLASLLKRMPFLLNLTIKECGLDESVLVPAIARLRALKALSWQCNYGYPSRSFLTLIDALRPLPNLITLVLSGWNFRGMSPDIMPPLTQRLINVHAQLTADEQTNNVGYLLQSLSSNDGRPAALSLDMTLFSAFDTYALVRTFPSVQLSLSNLHTLHIINKGGFSGYNLTQSRALVATCSSLRLLHIQSQNAQVAEFLDVLPSSLEELQFSWFDMWISPWPLIDAHLPSLVLNKTRTPELRKIVVYNYELAFNRSLVEGDELSDGHPCPKAQDACDFRGVVLDLYSKPPFWRLVDI